MKKRLYVRFIIGYLLYGILGLILINTIISPMMQDNAVAKRSKTMYDQATLISKYYSSNNYKQLDDYYNASSQLSAISTITDSHIWIVGTNGQIRYDSSKEFMAGTKLASFDSSFFGSNYYFVGPYYSFDDKNTITVIAPITHNFRTYGYVLMISAGDNAYMELYNSYMTITHIVYAILMVLSLIIFAALVISVYKPLNKITVAAKAYSKGHLDYGNIHVHTNDEFGQLAKNLEYMASQLSDREDYQHKFIANISHDFRSPLTSIKGYVEAMLDGTIPVERQEHYLNIVLNETERLNKLTSDLLTINEWDNNGRELNLSDFDINRVIKNTLTSFEGVCEKKNIMFDLILQSKTYMVTADLSKIQQVIYNLIDNALKFSPNDSTIKISVHDRHDKVFVSIKDHGIGIPKNSITKIWDRFYKTDLSRGKDKTGSGLGLSITKEIIQTHKENIDVISTEGVGTEFIFTLTKTKQSK